MVHHTLSESCMVRHTLSESSVWSVRPCQNPLLGQSDPVRIPCLVSQTLSQSPAWSFRPCHSPLCGQLDPIRISCSISQIPIKTPIWSVSIPCMVRIPWYPCSAPHPCSFTLTFASSQVSLEPQMTKTFYYSDFMIDYQLFPLLGKTVLKSITFAIWMLHGDAIMLCYVLLEQIDNC